MYQRQLTTPLGTITYWVSKQQHTAQTWLVFLPGLTADHHLFAPQLKYFAPTAHLLVWDAPAHGRSRPFDLSFSLDDLARWLADICDTEGVERPLLIGQSFGGYIGQAFMELFPERARGFISIDSAPLQRSYYTSIELWLLKHSRALYRPYPWPLLKCAGAQGVSTTAAGRSLMQEWMAEYSHREYLDLVEHGYRILGEAVTENHFGRITCPTLLLCGARDHAGSTKRYNKAWHRQTQIPLTWIAQAGHNSTIDNPAAVNHAIATFISSLPSERQ
ncbi:MAG: alpha/beta hydrolase [Arcanobacterium sp.]|nr:alpha/beta hydrolase [Arcanobacterium sp.]